MLDKLKYLETNGKKYPMAFTLNVMENVQETYGSIDEWMKTLVPSDEKGEDDKESKEPSIKDIKWAFKEFINEGIEIENDETGGNRPLLSLKQVGRIISDIGLKGATKTLQGVTISSVVNENSKNE